MAEGISVATSGDKAKITVNTTREMETLASGWRVPAWRSKAACRSTDPTLMFPENGRPQRTATAGCSSCPVRKQCLESALESPWMPYGPWGGLPQTQVQAMWLDRHPKDRSDEDSVLAYIGVV